MTAAWASMMEPHLALTLLVVDFPRSDRCSDADWDCAIEAAGRAKARTGANVAMVTTLPENLSERIAERLTAVGVIPLLGMTEAIEAVEAAASFTRPANTELLLPTPSKNPKILSEATAKKVLAMHDLRIPNAQRATSPENAAAIAETIGFSVALKGEGVAHKSEANAVALNLQTPDAVQAAATTMPVATFLVEEMLTGGVAELLIGVVKDPAHGFVLTLGAGGTLTEVLTDTTSMLIPATRDDIDAGLQSLKSAKLLNGFRGAPAADMQAILDAIAAIQNYVLANADGLEEVEVNPLICTPTDAIAADALIRRDT